MGQKIIVSNRGDTVELRTIIVPVTSTRFSFSWLISEIERIDRLHLQTQVYCFHDLVEDLLTELVQEHFTLVLRISFVLNNVDVRVEGGLRLFGQSLCPCLDHCSTVHGSVHRQDPYHQW